MRLYKQGAYVRVTVSYHEVRNFKLRWPCSTLPSRGVSFTLDARNGDLVDMAPDSMDGADVAALSEDAKEFAVSRGAIALYQ